MMDENTGQLDEEKSNPVVKILLILVHTAQCTCP